MMDYSRMKAFVKNEIIISPDIDGFDLSVYIYASVDSFYALRNDANALIPAKIASQIFPIKEIKTRIITKIKSSLDKLVEYEFIIGEKYSGNGYIVDPEQFRNYEEKYSVANFNEIYKIISLPVSYNFDLVKLYFLIISSKNTPVTLLNGRKGYVCDYAMTWFISVMGISSNTLSKYIKTLEDADLISVFRSDVPHNNNIYGLKEDAEFVEARGRKHHTPRRTNQANYRRGLMQKYYWITQGHVYSPEETREIYDYLLYHNELMRQLHENCPDKGYLNKIKDISILKIKEPEASSITHG